MNIGGEESSSSSEEEKSEIKQEEIVKTFAKMVDFDDEELPMKDIGGFDAFY